MKRATNGGDAADNPDNDIVWGAVAIGKVIGRNERQTRHMLGRHLSDHCSDRRQDAGDRLQGWHSVDCAAAALC